MAAVISTPEQLELQLTFQLDAGFLQGQWPKQTTAFEGLWLHAMITNVSSPSWSLRRVAKHVGCSHSFVRTCIARDRQLGICMTVPDQSVYTQSRLSSGTACFDSNKADRVQRFRHMPVTQDCAHVVSCQQAEMCRFCSESPQKRVLSMVPDHDHRHAQPCS